MEEFQFVIENWSFFAFLSLIVYNVIRDYIKQQYMEQKIKHLELVHEKDVQNIRERISDLEKAETDMRKETAVLSEQIRGIHTSINDLRSTVKDEYKNLREYILNLTSSVRSDKI